MYNEGLKVLELEDKENITKDSNTLKEITDSIISNHKKRFYKEIKKSSNQYYDSLHLKFIQDKNPNFEELHLIKEIFDFLKNQD